MAYKIGDRVRQTTTTTGTGDVTLIAASAGFQNFSAALSDGDTCPYLIDDGAGNWELGVGTFHSAGPSLSRTTVLKSSNANSLVSFGAGTKTVSLELASGVTPFLGSGGNLLTPVLSVAVPATSNAAILTMAAGTAVTVRAWNSTNSGQYVTAHAFYDGTTLTVSQITTSSSGFTITATGAALKIANANGSPFTMNYTLT